MRANAAIQSRHITVGSLPPDATEQLLLWLVRAGADEFNVTVLGIRGEVAVDADAFEDAIEPFVLGLARRRVLADADGAGSTREVRVFTFSVASLNVLLPFIREGLFHHAPGPGGWLEDFAFYRHGELMLGVVTHLQEGTLRLTAAEHADIETLGVTSTASAEWIGY